MNGFKLSGRIGHQEQTGRRREVVLYNRRTVRGDDGQPTYQQQRLKVVAFGQVADELAEYPVGRVIEVGGYIRATSWTSAAGQAMSGIDLVVTTHAPIAPAASEPTAVQAEPETAAEPEAAVQAEPEAAASESAVEPAVAPKRPRRRARAVEQRAA